MQLKIFHISLAQKSTESLFHCFFFLSFIPSPSFGHLEIGFDINVVVVVLSYVYSVVGLNY